MQGSHLDAGCCHNRPEDGPQTAGAETEFKNFSFRCSSALSRACHVCSKRIVEPPTSVPSRCYAPAPAIAVCQELNHFCQRYCQRPVTKAEPWRTVYWRAGYEHEASTRTCVCVCVFVRFCPVELCAGRTASADYRLLKLRTSACFHEFSMGLASEPRISRTPRTSSGTSGSPFKLLCKCSELARPCGYREVEVLIQDASHFRFMVEKRSLRIDHYLGWQRSPGSVKRSEVGASRIRPSHALSASTCSS